LNVAARLRDILSCTQRHKCFSGSATRYWMSRSTCRGSRGGARGGVWAQQTPPEWWRAPTTS